MITDVVEFIGTNINALLFGAVIVEALTEILGDFLPSKYSVKGARVIAAVVGVTVAFALDISIVPIGAKIYQYVFGIVIAGLIMSRSAEWVHSLVKSVTSLPSVINTDKQKLK